MLAVQGEPLPFLVHFTEDGEKKTGLTVTVNIYRLAKADMSKSDLVSDGACTEIASGGYRYLLASGSNNADGVYFANFHTATATVDQQDIAAAWFVGYGSLASIAGILEDTGTTIPATITTIDNEIATIDGIVDNILEDTGTTIPATITTIDNEIATIDGIVDDILEDTGTTIPNSMALEATLTAIKGAGWSDETLVAIDTLIDAIKAKTDELTFTEANKVDANATVDAEAVADAIEPLIPTADNIWSATSRTLTQTATEITSSISGSSITQVRGNTWSFGITGVTLDSNKQQFAIKRNASQPDADAILLIDSETGLLRLNGAAATEAQQAKASLSYAGTTLTVTVDADIVAALPAGSFDYGIQSITAAGVVAEPYSGTFTITADIVRATE
jgi:hypothetical protein